MTGMGRRPSPSPQSSSVAKGVEEPVLRADDRGIGKHGFECRVEIFTFGHASRLTGRELAPRGLGGDIAWSLR